MGRHRRRGFSGGRFPICLRAYCHRSRSCPYPGNVVRSSRQVLEGADCPGLNRYPSFLTLAKSTGQLARVFLWGSFVTSKEVPNDLDVLLVMDTGFVVEAVPAQAQVVFDHIQARLRFHADVFWTKASLDPQVLHLWLDTYQTGKDFTRRGIVEVVVA